MSSKEKILERIRRNPRNVSQTDFESLIIVFGVIEEGGSHPKALIGDFTMPYKREKRIKTCYVTELIEIIDATNIKNKKQNIQRK